MVFSKPSKRVFWYGKQKFTTAASHQGKKHFIWEVPEKV